MNGKQAKAIRKVIRQHSTTNELLQIHSGTRMITVGIDTNGLPIKRQVDSYMNRYDGNSYRCLYQKAKKLFNQIPRNLR